MQPVIRRENVEQPGALSMVRSIDQFEVDVEGTVGLGGPAIAGGERDPIGPCAAVEKTTSASSGSPAGDLDAVGVEQAAPRTSPVNRPGCEDVLL